MRRPTNLWRTQQRPVRDGVRVLFGTGRLLFVIVGLSQPVMRYGRVLTVDRFYDAREVRIGTYR